jgi:hypothetical protein
MEEVRGQQAPPHVHEVIPYEYHFDFVSVLKSLKPDDLRLKPMQQGVQYQSMSFAMKSILANMNSSD